MFNHRVIMSIKPGSAAEVERILKDAFSRRQAHSASMLGRGDLTYEVTAFDEELRASKAARLGDK